MQTIIPTEYWRGQNLIDIENPWLTPGSIAYINNYLKKEFEVLEFGSGGSTFFFSRRCKYVTSFETDKYWFSCVQDNIKKKEITNVSLFLIHSEEECYLKIKEKSKIFDVILVDTIVPSNIVQRYSLLTFAMSVFSSNGFIILDNYDWIKKHEIISDKWKIIDFDDPHWNGKGTRIFIKK